MSTKLLSPQELRVWHAFRMMGDDVLDRAGREITEATGLSGPDFGVLSRLAALGKGEMRQQNLAECLGWDKSRLSHQITRMENADLVRRENCESDRRGLYAVLTEHGLETMKKVAPYHVASVRRHFMDLVTPEGLSDLSQTLKPIAEHLRGQRGRP